MGCYNELTLDLRVLAVMYAACDDCFLHSHSGLFKDKNEKDEQKSPFTYHLLIPFSLVYPQR